MIPPVEDLADALDVDPATAERILGSVIRGWLDYLYPVPDEFDTHEQWQRREHNDLPTLARSHLLLEGDRLELRLRIDRRAHPWLVERLKKLREVIGHAR